MRLRIRVWGFLFYLTAIIIKAMKRKSILWISLAGLMLTGCAGDVPPDQSGSVDPSASSSVPKTGNTLASVLGSFGTNMRSNVIFNFLGSSKIPSIVMDYVDNGVQFEYKNFPDTYVKGGYLNENGKAYAWTNSEVDHWNEKKSKAEKVDLAVKDPTAIKDKNGNEVASFRDAFYDPSYIGEHLQDFLAPNVFIPKIKGTTFGTFNLFGKVYESELDGEEEPVEPGEEEEVEEAEQQSEEEEIPTEEEPSGALVQDNTEILMTLCRCLGVYDTAASFDATLQLNSADFYFSEKGSSFSFNFYFTYQGGYDRLYAKVAISKIGDNSVPALTNYFDPDFEIYTPEP